jgi:hypothetical protein
MVKNGKNRCEFIFSDDTLRIIDVKKKELGYSTRSDVLRYIIHDTQKNQISKSIDINSMILSLAIIFSVGVITGTLYLQMIGIIVGVLILVYFLKR